MDAMLSGYLAGLGTTSNQEAFQRFSALAKTEEGERKLMEIGSKQFATKEDIRELNDIGNKIGVPETKQTFGQRARQALGAD